MMAVKKGTPPPPLDAMLAQIPKFTSLYPDREEVECTRCRCRHWKDGRCFADDARGWAIIRGLREGAGFRRRLEAEEADRAKITEQAALL